VRGCVEREFDPENIVRLNHDIPPV